VASKGRGGRGRTRRGNAETLRQYWSVGGEGGRRIRWGTRNDWVRCNRLLSKYMGARARGYCQLLHRRNTGVYTGSRANVGWRGR